MYCSNCKAEVEAPNGYCERCNMALSARLCLNGHVMDPSWTECKNCPPEERIPIGSAKGATLVEDASRAGSSDFVTGATLLEDSRKAPTVKETRKPKTVVDAGHGAAGSAKGKTVFDPGGAPAEDAAVPQAPEARLVGWLVTFSLLASGNDYRIREGRNVIGADPEQCDVVIGGSPTLSSKHAVLMFRDGNFLLRDSDSTNGTYVNGKDIFGEGAVPVQNQDEIQLGKVKLVLYTIESPTASSD